MRAKMRYTSPMIRQDLVLQSKKLIRTFKESRALDLVQWIADHSISGIGPLISADALAKEYLDDLSYRDNSARIRSLIRWECSKNFGSGFVTSLGGLGTLPAAIPASLGASWVVQARLAAAIAIIYGHNVTEDRVRTLVVLSLLGNAATEELRQAGVRLGNQMASHAIRQLSSRLVKEINHIVGFKLMSETSQRGMVRFARFVPIAGGVLGGAFDSVACRTVGRVADGLFTPVDSE
jgi:uncharacterized protein (DUF697 family)